jgi:hypothetical protein
LRKCTQLAAAKKTSIPAPLKIVLPYYRAARHSQPASQLHSLSILVASGLHLMPVVGAGKVPSLSKNCARPKSLAATGLVRLAKLL